MVLGIEIGDLDWDWIGVDYLQFTLMQKLKFIVFMRN